MYARERDTGECSAGNQRMLVLADLISLRDVRVEITLAVELGEIRELTADCRTEAQNVPHRLAIHYRQCARGREADGTDVHVRLRLVGIVRRVAEHLGFRLQFCVYLKAYRRAGHCYSRTPI